MFFVQPSWPFAISLIAQIPISKCPGPDGAPNDEGFCIFGTLSHYNHVGHGNLCVSYCLKFLKHLPGIYILYCSLEVVPSREWQNCIGITRESNFLHLVHNSCQIQSHHHRVDKPFSVITTSTSPLGQWSQSSASDTLTSLCSRLCYTATSNSLFISWQTGFGPRLLCHVASGLLLLITAWGPQCHIHSVPVTMESV